MGVWRHWIHVPRAAPVVYLAVQAQHPKSHLSNLDIPAVHIEPCLPMCWLIRSRYTGAGHMGSGYPAWLGRSVVWKYLEISGSSSVMSLHLEKLFTLSGVAGKLARFLEWPNVGRKRSLWFKHFLFLPCFLWKYSKKGSPFVVHFGFQRLVWSKIITKESSCLVIYDSTRPIWPWCHVAKSTVQTTMTCHLHLKVLSKECDCE